jgi:ABC-2 type transport system permease protein
MRTLTKLTWVEVKLFGREPIAVVFALAFPLVVLLVLAGAFGNDVEPFGGVRAVEYYVPGYLAVVIASVGLIGLPVHLAGLRERGVLRRLRASSVPTGSIFAAQVIVNFAMAAIGAGVLLIAARLVYDVGAPDSVGAVALAFVVGTLAFVALGLLIGSLARSARAAQAIGLVVFFPTWLLSGAGPPPSAMTDTMRDISEILPLTHVVNAIQDPWLGRGSNVADLLVLAAILVGAAALSGWSNTERAVVPRVRPSKA